MKSVTEFNGYTIYQEAERFFEVNVDGRMFGSRTLEGAKRKVLMNQRNGMFSKGGNCEQR